MGTRDLSFIQELGAADWRLVLGAVSKADAYLRDALPGDAGAADVVEQLVVLSVHSKWEVRRAVAATAGQVLHPSFDVVLAQLRLDDNARVRQAAEQSALRRRDWQNASTFGRQHEKRINSVLDDIEARYGVPGREAVKRASEKISDTFARELYHEVIKLISPIASSADRLKMQALDGASSPTELAREAERVEARVAHLRAVLDAMRSFTAQPSLHFQMHQIHEVIEEAVTVVREGDALREQQVAIVLDVSGRAEVQICRPRIIQALTNILTNAVESYEGLVGREPIAIHLRRAEGRVDIVVEDHGCGMSEEAQADALVLFSTTKSKGTGFGLPLAKKILETEHGGRLQVDSALGRGTNVCIALPLSRRGGER